MTLLKLEVLVGWQRSNVFIFIFLGGYLGKEEDCKSKESWRREEENCKAGKEKNRKAGKKEVVR